MKSPTIRDLSLAFVYISYASVNLVAAYGVTATASLHILPWFVLPCPAISIAIVSGVQFAVRPRPFSPISLTLFVLGVLVAAALSLLTMGEIGLALS